ncbi:hypothetical protein EPK97_12175 [Chengkuizengella sediminis]|nr:hypothetical protein [Chengkuizengella sediminis]
MKLPGSILDNLKASCRKTGIRRFHNHKQLNAHAVIDIRRFQSGTTGLPPHRSCTFHFY